MQTTDAVLKGESNIREEMFLPTSGKTEMPDLGFRGGSEMEILSVYVYSIRYSDIGEIVVGSTNGYEDREQSNEGEEGGEGTRRTRRTRRTRWR